MKTEIKQLLKKALQLNSNERAFLVDGLLSSLDETSDENVESLWQSEVEKRLREIVENNVKLIPWNEVKESIRSKLNA